MLVSPPLAEVNKFLSKMVKSLVELTHAFVRWMHGTCARCDSRTWSLLYWVVRAHSRA